MRVDKWAVTAQEAFQAAMGIAADAEASQMKSIHLLKALLSSGERNIRAISSAWGPILRPSRPRQMPLSLAHPRSRAT